MDWYKLPEWQNLATAQKDSLHELYQYVDFWVKTGAENKIHLTNQYDFSHLDHLHLQWQIIESGKILSQGESTALEVLLPFSFTTFKDSNNVTFRFSLHLKEKTEWAEKTR